METEIIPSLGYDWIERSKQKTSPNRYDVWGIYRLKVNADGYEKCWLMIVNEQFMPTQQEDLPLNWEFL